jgi:hypothetical protein
MSTCSLADIPATAFSKHTYDGMAGGHLELLVPSFTQLRWSI